MSDDQRTIAQYDINRKLRWEVCVMGRKIEPCRTFTEHSNIYFNVSQLRYINLDERLDPWRRRECSNTVTF